jgi:hypothetical protein
MSQRELYGFPHDGDLTWHNLVQAHSSAKARGDLARIGRVLKRMDFHLSIRSRGQRPQEVQLRGGHRRAFRC